MDQGILDNFFEQRVVEVAFLSPTLVCVAELQCPVLYSNLGCSITISEQLMLSIAGSGRIDMWHLQSFQEQL